MDWHKVHPQARTALETQRRSPLTVANLAGVRASMVEAAPAETGTGPDLPVVTDLDAGGVPARLYRPVPEESLTAGEPPAAGGPSAGRAGGLPVLVYAHGGGWTMGGLDTHDTLCRRLAADSGWAVLAVDYRLAPEHPYPAPVDDVWCASTWVRGSGAAPHGLDPARVAVGGDSSGGHLAAVVARRARDAGTPLAGQVLLCPVVAPPADYPPLDAYGLHRDEMRFFWDAFAPAGVDRRDPDVDPSRADLAGLPPALIITAELDILRDEGERYATALLAAGVPVTAARFQGLVHNFPRKLAIFDAAHAVLAMIAASLRRW